MTPKQKRFVEEYLIDLNATQAAIRAGYSAKTADKTGPKLVGKSSIAEAIKKAQARRSSRTGVTQDKVIKELARIAFVDPRRLFKWGPDGVTLIDSDKLTEDEAAVMSEVSSEMTENGVKTKGKRYDKIKALELLGKHLGMFIERQEITGFGGEPIVVKWSDEGHA